MFNSIVRVSGFESVKLCIIIGNDNYTSICSINSGKSLVTVKNDE